MKSFLFFVLFFVWGVPWSRFYPNPEPCSMLHGPRCLSQVQYRGLETGYKLGYPGDGNRRAKSSKSKRREVVVEKVRGLEKRSGFVVFPLMLTPDLSRTWLIFIWGGVPF